jgi:hypothetical protein
MGEFSFGVGKTVGMMVAGKIEYGMTGGRVPQLKDQIRIVISCLRSPKTETGLTQSRLFDRNGKSGLN